MTFPEFLDASAQYLSSVGGRIVQRRESDPTAGHWWLTFRRAAVLYRLRFDRGVATLFFEREQGSFAPGSASKWQLLDCREPEDFTFETALEVMQGMLERRWNKTPASPE